MDNIVQNLKSDSQDENCATNENEQNETKIKLDDLTTKRLCNSRCSICASEHIGEIHELRKAGRELKSIVDIMHEKYKVQFSTASLSRHFSNFFDRQMEISAQICNAELISEAAAKSFHTQRTLEILQMAFDQIKKRAINGSYIFDLSDIVKLMDLKYKTLVGNDSIDNDIMAIFQKATDKYGVSFQQATLFNNIKKPNQQESEATFERSDPG